MTRLLLLLALLAAGCAHVPAWQRGALMTPQMTEESDPCAAFDAHVLQTREAMRGATGAGGASCGCD